MKVGVNTLFLIPGEVGGSETYLRETLYAIATGFSSEVELVLFTNNENDKSLRELLGGCGNVSYVKLDFNACNRYARIIREQTELPRKAGASGVDVMWSPGYTAPFLSSCPQVVTIHDMQYKTHPQDMRPVARVTTDVLVKMAARRCRRIIAISQFTRTEVLKYTNARPEKIDVILEAANPVYSVKLEAPEIEARLAGLLPGKKPYILSISNTYPHKNMHAIVDAFRQIMGQIPHDLVMVGSPRLGEPALQKALNGLPDRHRMIRLKNLTREPLVALYQGADVFVFPSLYEGFGLPVLEAMMAGVPVVTTRFGSIPEVGGDTVKYFDPGREGDLSAKIREVLEWSGAQRLEVIERAKARAKSFSWARTAAETVECFRRCAKT